MDHRTPTQHQNLQPPHTRPFTTPESIPGLPVTTIHHTPPLSPIPSCTGPPAGHTKNLSQPPWAPPPIQSKQTVGNGQTGKPDKYIFGRGGPHHPISEPGQNNATSKTPRTMARITRKPHHNHLHRWLQTRQWVNWMWMGNLPLRRPTLIPTGRAQLSPRQPGQGV